VIVIGMSYKAKIELDSYREGIEQEQHALKNKFKIPKKLREG